MAKYKACDHYAERDFEAEKEKQDKGMLKCLSDITEQLSQLREILEADI